LSNPKDGWITLSITTPDDSVDIVFSDVGPDSIGQLQQIVTALRQGSQNGAAEFHLEPAVASLDVSCSGATARLGITIDRQHPLSLIYDRQAFVNELDSELKRIVPLCTEWTNPGQEKN